VLVLCTHNTHTHTHTSGTHHTLTHALTHSLTHSLTWLERGGEAGHASPAEQLGRTASGRKHCEWNWTGLDCKDSDSGPQSTGCRHTHADTQAAARREAE
jgi:hypothetical protein